jgi:hypothetical protein
VVPAGKTTTVALEKSGRHKSPSLLVLQFRGGGIISLEGRAGGETVAEEKIMVAKNIACQPARTSVGLLIARMKVGATEGFLIIAG